MRMIILGIETSCDETSLSVVEVTHTENPTFNVKSHHTNSQIKLHEEYGGVFPNLAKREHAKNILPILEITLTESHLLKKENTKLNEKDISLSKGYLDRYSQLFDDLLSFVSSHQIPDIDYIAVTTGPGLAPALWVGVSFAKALSQLWNKPLVPVNHMEGHIFSVFAEKEKFTITKSPFPALALLVSGGHTELVIIKNWQEYHKIGQTIDDAAGEAFDKTARLLNLGYPGGPKISQRAELARKTNQINKDFKLPRPMLHHNSYNFSFSGLKTATRRLVESNQPLDEDKINKIALEFENAVIEVLVTKTMKAIEEYDIKTLILAGGVAANKYLRDTLKKTLQTYHPHIIFKLPDTSFAGDNSLMISTAAYFNIINQNYPSDISTIEANSNWSL